MAVVVRHPLRLPRRRPALCRPSDWWPAAANTRWPSAGRRAGPFELLDEIGLGNALRLLEAAGEPVPALLHKAQASGAGRFYREEVDGPEYLGFDGAYHVVPRPAGTLAVADLRRAGKPVLGNASASLWDMGDGVALLEFHTKMNALDEYSVEAMEQIGRASCRERV